MVRRLICFLALTLYVSLTPPEFLVQGQEQSRPYETSLSIQEMTGKQGILDTDLGTIVIDFLPRHAPNHVGLFIKLAEDGEYDNTIFHRMVRHGIVQGGDPLTKDPSNVGMYGRGGLGLLTAEPNEEAHERGAVSTVVVPGQPDSGGMQFFICVVDQPGLDGHHTVWARVSEGMDVVTKISEAPVDSDGLAVERVVLRSVTIRDSPAPEVLSFSSESDAELSRYRAILETDVGQIEIEFYADRAPNHVRNFLRLADAGVYDGVAFHRVVKGFVIQTGYLPSRREPLNERQERLIQTLQPEFSATSHVKGIVSMARGEDLASASTSFFICTASAEELDGLYTAFGIVTQGLQVVDAIEAIPTLGETPNSRLELRRVSIIER